jgi:hypothetical protein
LNPIYPKDPRWSIQPADYFSTRIVSLINNETQGIDVNVLRFESTSLMNALISRHRDGLPVRVNTESSEYRSIKRPMVSFVLDSLYAAGVPLKWRAHSGNNHEKVGIFHAQRRVVQGSSNWSPGSDRNNSNIEINFFSDPVTNPEDLEAYTYYTQKFERRWSNLQYVDGLQVIESKPFVPLPPGSASNVSPAHQSTVSTATPRLTFKVRWAHYVDVYYGRSSTSLTLYRSRMRVNPNTTVSVTLPTLSSGTYYWRVISRTAANLTSTGATWWFRVP